MLNKMLINNKFMTGIKPTILLATLLVTLTGCESTVENEEFRVAELKSINSSRVAEVLWREQSGNGVDNYYSNLRPAIANDVLFAASREGEVTAFDAKTGEELWQVDARENPLSWWQKITLESQPSGKFSGGITAAYDNLYIGTENGEVIGLSQKTGEVLWRTEVKGEVVSAPAAGEGWIVVTTTSGHVAAMHPDTGELRWQVETDVPALSLRGTSTPSISNGGVLVGTATGKLSVILLEGGVPAWETAIGNPEGSTELEQLIDADSRPLVSGSTVYAIAYNGNLAAIDIMSGRVLWKREYSSYRNISLDAGVLYLTDAKGNIIAVDAASGVERWTNSEFYNRRLTQPVIYKDTVVVGDFEGYFHFVDKTTGKIASRFKLDDFDYSKLNWFVSWFTSEDRRAYTAPVAEGDTLYIQTRDGEVTALRLP